MNLLPTDSAARKELEDHVTKAIRKYIEREKGDVTRDPAGIVLGLFFIVGAIVSVYFAINGPAWLAFILWPVGAFLGLLGMFGFARDVTPRKRDAKGNPVG